jgi:hypothetical protein
VYHNLLFSALTLGRADKPVDDGNRLGAAFVPISLWIFSGSDDLEMGVRNRLYLQPDGSCSRYFFHGRIVSALSFADNFLDIVFSR